MQSAIYGLGEFLKTISYEETVGGVTTTYLGLAYYDHEQDNKNFKSDLDYRKPIFKIKKTIETVVGGLVTTVTYLPVKDGKPCQSFDMVWDSGVQEFLNYTYL